MITDAEILANRKTWTDALRSNKYGQARAQLRDLPAAELGGCGTMPVPHYTENSTVDTTNELAAMYLTAQVTLGCAGFPPGAFVNVRYSHTGTNGTRWFDISATGEPSRVTLPEHHLTAFCL